MKKVYAFIIVFILIFSTDSFSLCIPQKTAKNNKVELTKNKRARYGLKPLSKQSQKRMQKLRIKNHNQKKTNIMRKS
jgi:hypothetical protein